jgi:hypothetical protein
MLDARAQSMLSCVRALAVAAFAIGVAEFIEVGVLPAIAADLGVPPACAGGAVQQLRHTGGRTHRHRTGPWQFLRHRRHGGVGPGAQEARQPRNCHHVCPRSFWGARSW